MEETSRLLAGYGITGITDATYTNDKTTEAIYRQLDLRQCVNLMGDETLSSGSLKIMLDDASLPDLDRLQERIVEAHDRERPVAFHCVTRTELVFALAALSDAGTIPGDRIEHAVTDAATMALLHEVSGEARHVTVVTQPNFIAERGDQYLRDVPAKDHDNLYRCRGFLDAGLPLGGGTDAPFGDPNPWAAMHAAVERRAPDGQVIGVDEKLTPEEAMALFLTPLDNPGGSAQRVEVGMRADLCLLTRPWNSARSALGANLVAECVKA